MASAFYDLPAGGYIEVVAPTRDDSAISGALAKSGEGMNLIAFVVDDLRLLLTVLQLHLSLERA